MGRGNAIKRQNEQRLLRRPELVRAESRYPGKADPLPPDGLLWRAWDGAYTKEFYWLRRKGSERAVKCWPNAGYMNAADGSGRMWAKSDDLEVAMDDGEGD